MINTQQVTLIPVNELQAIVTATMNAVLDTRLNQLKPEVKEEYLTREETAKFLGISLPTLHQYTLTERIKGYRIGTRVRYKKSELDSALRKISTR